MQFGSFSFDDTRMKGGSTVKRKRLSEVKICKEKRDVVSEYISNGGR